VSPALIVRISPANSGQVRIQQFNFDGSIAQEELATAAEQSYTCFKPGPRPIKVTAAPGSGYQFDRWVLSPSQSGFSPRSNPTEFASTNEVKTLTAYFTGGTTPPPTVPNPPTNVQASSGTYSDRVRITWAASTGATSYEVHRATSATGSRTRIATPTGTSYNDFNTTCPNIYYYWIRAVSSAGVSGFSSSSTGYCQTGTTPPPISGDVTPVSVADAKKMLDEKVGLIVVDISDRDDYERDHILCARHAFYNDFFGVFIDYEAIGLTPYKTSDILVYDQRAINAQTAAQYLADEGFSSVFYLTGGLKAWIDAGHETVPCSYECEGCDLPPMAHAGADKTVNENQIFTLDGSGSVNPGAGVLTYLWQQYNPGNKNSRADISNPDAAQPTVTAPNVQEGGETLIFHLTVTEAQGREDMDSVAVKVNWAFDNRPPTARAGADQEVDGGVEVILNGSGSTDLDDGIATYQWVQTGGAVNVTLTGASTPVAGFIAPLAENEPLELVFELTVTDNGGQSDTDEVTITVSVGNQKPVADAGEPQTVGETALVTLDGSDSSDPDGDTLFYEWRQVGGSRNVDLMQPSSARPSFIAPMVSGDPVVLTFELTVSDNKGLVDSDLVEITVEDVGEPPFADAGRSRMVYEGDMVNLDGFGSFDLDGEIMSYQWVQVNNPAVTIIGETTATASFMAPDVDEGQITLIFQLTVTDNTGLVDSDTVKIGVSSGKAPPVADAGPDQIVNEGDMVVLDGPSSSGLSETITDYQWEQLSGPEVLLSDPTVRTTEFKAPKVGVDLTALQFKLHVEYASGHVSTDTVDVYIKKNNCSSDSTCFISTLNDSF
jgi:rhodanese-related sulfurtransferase